MLEVEALKPLGNWLAVEALEPLGTWLYKQLWKETVRKNNQYERSTTKN